ncbi:MAG: NAD-dependent epimerase/dehydratase family protein [Ardenticatenia bacterium]|nr:NAD-dependent epimerase/dehydratase family protein [Ardenticatenia bacterium]
MTGATGPVGRALVAALTARGARVRVVVHAISGSHSLPWPNVELMYTDLAAPNVEHMRRAVAGCRVIFHLAAVTSASNPQRLYVANVQGTKVLVEAARLAGVSRFVMVSTLATVGRPWNAVPEGETWLQQATHYVRSRFLAEEVALMAGHKGLLVNVLNLPAVVAPRMPLTHPVVRWLTRESEAWCALPDAAPIHLVALNDVVQLLVAMATGHERLGRVVPLAPDGDLTAAEFAKIWDELRISPRRSKPVQFAWRDHPPVYYRLVAGEPRVHRRYLSVAAKPLVRSLLKRAVGAHGRMLIHAVGER